MLLQSMQTKVLCSRDALQHRIHCGFPLSDDSSWQIVHPESRQLRTGYHTSIIAVVIWAPVRYTGHATCPELPVGGAGRILAQQPGPGGEPQEWWGHGGPGRAAGPSGDAAGRCLPGAQLAVPRGTDLASAAASPASFTCCVRAVLGLDQSLMCSHAEHMAGVHALSSTEPRSEHRTRQDDIMRMVCTG